MHGPMDVSLFVLAWAGSGVILGIAWLVFFGKGKAACAHLGISPNAALYTLAALSFGWLLIAGLVMPR